MRFSRLLSWYRSTFGQALTGAALLWAALPPLDLWPLAWIAPVWWLLLIRREDLPGRRPYLTLWLVGFLFWMAAIHWLRLPHPATSIGWVALSAYLACYLPVFVGLTRVAVRRLSLPLIAAAPVVWTGLELARAHLLTGFTMASLGHTQYRWIQLIQISDLAGGYGVSFVVMLVAACLAQMAPCQDQRFRAWPLLPAAAVLAAVLGYGYAKSPTRAPQHTARIALIQGSIDVEMKYDRDPEKRRKKQEYIYKQYFGLSQEAVRRYGPLDLIVWPETMFPGTLYVEEPGAHIPDEWKEEEPRLRRYSDQQCQALVDQLAARSRQAIGSLARELETPLLLGISSEVIAAGRERSYNSAVLVTREGAVAGRYDKMHRVLFGEYVPFAEQFPWLQRLTPLPVSIAAGDEAAAFPVAGLRIAPNICYETVLPHVIRRQVRQLAHRGQEPDVLVNLTNDGWFWGSSELDMHLACGVFRAVECRKPLLIAANTGFSAWIDSSGRILQQGPRRQTGVLLATVGAENRPSWYLDHGDWFAGCCLAACLALAGVGLANRLARFRVAHR